MKDKDTVREKGITMTFHNVPPRDEAHRKEIMRVIDGVFDTIFEEMIKQRDNKKNYDTDDTFIKLMSVDARLPSLLYLYPPLLHAK